MMKKKVSRPLSSAASFFRKNGTSNAHRSIPRPTVPTPSTSSAVSGLNSSPEELNHLLISVFPLLVNFLGNEDPGLEGMFVVDPSASSQEAMMGLTDPSQREPVRALREILDARFQGGSESAILRAHHVYVWGIALKLLLKELIAKKQPVITPVAVGMLNESAAKPDRLDFLKQRRFADFVSVPAVNLFHVMHRCRTSKEKLGFVFAVLLFGSEHNVEQMSKTTQFLMTNAEELFGASPFPAFRSASSSGVIGMGNQSSASTPMLSSSSASLPLQQPQFQLSPNKFLFTATCTFDFDPESPDELELRVGDIIEVLECIDDEWFKGRLHLPDGTVEEGLFPAAFVKRETPVALAPPPPPPSQSPMQFSPSPAAVQQPVVFDQPPPPPPQVFDQSLPPPSPPPPPQQQQQVMFEQSPPPVSESESAMLAIALFDFVAEEEGELMLQKGERLVILDQTDPDWWLGKRVRDGVQGLFPFNYANMLSSSTTTSSNVFTAAVPFAPSTATSSPPPAPAPITVTPVLSSAPAMPPGPKPTATKPASQRVTGSRPRPPPPPNPINIILPPSKAAAAPKPTPPPPPAVVPDIPLAIADPVANGWTITADAYTKYLGFFHDQPKDETRRRVVGRDMAQFLVQSGLPKQTIARVLELSDIDKDQRFDSDEFALAMHLALCISKRKMPLPSTLPPYLVPKTKRAAFGGGN